MKKWLWGVLTALGAILAFIFLGRRKPNVELVKAEEQKKAEEAQQAAKERVDADPGTLDDAFSRLTKR